MGKAHGRSGVCSGRATCWCDKEKEWSEQEEAWEVRREGQEVGSSGPSGEVGKVTRSGAGRGLERVLSAGSWGQTVKCSGLKNGRGKDMRREHRGVLKEFGGEGRPGGRMAVREGRG